MNLGQDERNIVNSIRFQKVGNEYLEIDSGISVVKQRVSK